MDNDPRYEPVSATLPSTLPPITREEARRASRRLFRHFGGRQHGSPNMVNKPRASVRKCWLSSKSTTGHFKGWGRLVHDVSHIIFRARHPSFRPHDGGHAVLEREVAEYVVASGWLDGTLRTVEPTADQKRDEKKARVNARLARWETKLKRATTAVRKLRRQLARMEAA